MVNCLLCLLLVCTLGQVTSPSGLVICQRSSSLSPAEVISENPSEILHMLKFGTQASFYIVYMSSQRVFLTLLKYNIWTEKYP
jgi:hypothetical protein